MNIAYVKSMFHFIFFCGDLVAGEIRAPTTNLIKKYCLRPPCRRKILTCSKILTIVLGYITLYKIYVHSCKKKTYVCGELKHLFKKCKNYEVISPFVEKNNYLTFGKLNKIKKI